MTQHTLTCPCGANLFIARKAEGDIRLEITPDGPSYTTLDVKGGVTYGCTREGCTEELDEDFCEELPDLYDHLLAM